MSWQGKRILVTGAGGFIGIHLVDNLVTSGALVRALVHYRSDGSWGLLDESEHKNDVEVVAGDICDRDSVKQAMHGREVVFHLAALIAIPYSYHAPLSYIRTNVEGALTVLQSARETGIARLVHTSTSEAYGTARYVPIDEGHPLQAQSPYSATKIAADKLAESFHLSFGVPVVTVRPFNTFGPRQSARAIIPTIITQALMQPTIHLGSLEPTRDFSYVSDTVQGLIRAAECPEAIGQVINIGSGREISVGDLAALILKLVGRQDMAVTCDDERVRPDQSEIEQLCADNRKAQQILGWRPQHTLEEGLVRTIEWIRNNLERYRVGIYAI